MKKTAICIIMALVLSIGLVLPAFAAEQVNQPPTPPYAPNVETASEWAQGYISLAVYIGLVPEALQLDYSEVATRAEFAALAVTLYESRNGEIAGRTSFADTTDINAEKMAYLGVAAGVGNNMFAPDGPITREEVAVIISRLSDAIGYALPVQEPAFADYYAISSWASESIGQMQATGIMDAIDDNLFTPQGHFTREESIITMLRLFDFINGQESEDEKEEIRAQYEQTTFPESGIIIPYYRRLTPQERGYWIDEYWLELDGPFEFELEVIQLINEIRLEHDLHYLKIDKTLLMGARLYAQIMANLDTELGHNEGPYRVRGATYGASHNVAFSFGGQVRQAGGLAVAGLYTPQELVDMWMSSRVHRNFILDPEHRFIGFGAHAGGQWGAFQYLHLSDLGSNWIMD